MSFRSIKDMDVRGKTVLLRADLNVPAQRGKVTDTTRIDRLKPTIDYLCKHGARILILSHFGRPEGEQNPEMSLAFLVPALQKCWNISVRFAPNCIGKPAQDLAESLQDGEVGLLENLRFHKGETENAPHFAKDLASLGDIYVNDAFSAAHRAHASTEGIAKFLPAAAGLLMARELKALDRALGNPARPVAAIAGGSKISTKLSVLLHLVNKVDVLVLGGGMANTFIYAQGGDIGGSLCEQDMAEQARKIMDHAKDVGCDIVLQSDAVSVTEISTEAETQIVPANDIPQGRMAIDVGPQSANEIIEKIQSCKTLVWNGPMGVFEIPPFDRGTNNIANAVADMTKSGSLISIAGGGDTVAALENAGCSGDFSYISTAGGAFLEWMEGKTLPGVAALESLEDAA